MEYYRATIDDIGAMIEIRLSILKSANGLPDNTDFTNIKHNLYSYYQDKLRSGEHIAFLAKENENIVATGGICFYQVLPTYHNPSGQKAYIINMFTEPEYRRKGIATKILDLLVKESLNRGVEFISLEATSMGKAVYENYGFKKMGAEMQLYNQTFG